MALEQKPQPVSEKFNLHWFIKQRLCYSLLRACKLYTDDHYQSATKNVLPFIRKQWTFVCVKCFVLTSHFSISSCSRALSVQYSAQHTSRKNQLARIPAYPWNARIGVVTRRAAIRAVCGEEPNSLRLSSFLRNNACKNLRFWTEQGMHDHADSLIVVILLCWLITTIHLRQKNKSVLI